MKRTALVSFTILLLAASISAQEKKTHIRFSPADLSWTAGPPSLPPGSKMVVLKGNPAEEGVFTMRLSLPANYRIAPHWHPAFENITILEGHFLMGVGEKFDETTLHAMGPGSFGSMAPGTRHFAATKEPAVIQLHGMGPWQIYYVNPDDDPRRPSPKPAAAH